MSAGYTACSMARSKQFMWVVGAAFAAMISSACTTSEPIEDNNTGDNYAGSPADDGTGDGSGSDDATGDDGDDGDGTGDDTGMVDPGTMADDGASFSPMLSTGCPAYSSSIYTPFENYGPVTTGKVSQYPWRGSGSTYPDTVEDFRSYSTPSTVECSSSKGTRNYLDVTSGCLGAVSAEGGIAGQIHGTSSGYYRSFSLPYDSATGRKVAWTDMGVEYRFKYSQWTGDVSGPGFKIFGRYMTEYDLYVGSWRMDGTVQIQKKHCGEYTILKRIGNFGAPSPNVWHTIKFETVGNQQKLYLDGQLVLTTTDDTIKRGTAGIRIDSAENALIDDWRVYAP
jgi:hypothetical protein